MKLIPEWRKSWRMVSMQAMVIAQAGLGAWVAMPDDLREHVPASGVIAFAISMLGIGMIGRLVKQDKVSG
jgi:hypothetical protein